MEVMLDYEDYVKEYTPNATFTAHIKGRDRKAWVKEVTITPFGIYLDADYEKQDGERVGGWDTIIIKMKDGTKYYDSGLEYSGSRYIDIEKDGDNIESIILFDHEVKLK